MAELVSIAVAVVYYALVAVGAVSIGYLALRLAAPDSRLLDDEHKLGYGAVLGVTLVVLSLLIDSILTSWESVLTASGALPLAFAVTAGASVGALRIWFTFNASETQVALPLHNEMDETQFNATAEPTILAKEAELNLERIEVQVKTDKTKSTAHISFDDLYTQLSEEEQAQKRRKALEKLLKDENNG